MFFDFTSSTLGYRWRSKPRSSLCFNPLTSVLTHSSRPRIRSQSPRSSMLHNMFRTSGQVLFCFVWVSRYQQLSWSASQGKRTNTKCGTPFFCCCDDAKPWHWIFQLHQERSQVCTVSFFVLCIYIYIYIYICVFVLPPHNLRAKYIRNAHRWCLVIR